MGLRRRTRCDSRLPLRPFGCASGPFTPNEEPDVSDAGTIFGTGRVRRRSPAMSQMESRIVADNRQSKETIMNPSTPSTGLRGLVATTTSDILASNLSIMASAEPSSASRTVKFADLNIPSPSGAHVLYMRILAAAQVVCSHYWFATDGDKARCVHDSIA